MDTRKTADIGIIGGTGLYDPEIFSDVRDVKIYTPFGNPSDISVGEHEVESHLLVDRMFFAVSFYRQPVG